MFNELQTIQEQQIINNEELAEQVNDDRSVMKQYDQELPEG